jgi:hypothetical protein
MISESSITISVNTYSGLIAYSFTDWYLMVQQFKEAGIIMQTRITNQCLETEQLLTNTLLGYFGAGNFKLISTKAGILN